jgi:Animal haem peroxidase
MAIITTSHEGVSLKDIRPNFHNEAQHFTPYCYLFPALANDDSKSLIAHKSDQQTRDILRSFAIKLSDPSRKDRTKLPAVYTYFGQFMNHDISAPTGSMVPGLERSANGDTIDIGQDLPGIDKTFRPSSINRIVELIRNQHQTPMTLHSLYGSGPGVSDAPSDELYVRDQAVFDLGQTKLFSSDELSMKTTRPDDVVQNKTPRWDLKRDPITDTPVIADHRNDENLIISQLHLAFMLFHNNAVAALKPKYADRRKLFEAARNCVTWHYQWCIVHDYLSKLLQPEFIAKALQGPNLLKIPNEVPMEFTTAAFRFGHSMVSDKYDFNDNFTEGGAMDRSASLNDLFAFTSGGRMNNSTDPLKQLPDLWVVDWARLTRVDAKPNSGADPIDTRIAELMIAMSTPSLKAGDDEHRSIIPRNILRGFHRRIPCGQSLVEALRLARGINMPVLSADKIKAMLPKEAAEIAVSNGLTAQTPAWLYFLCEAEAETTQNPGGPPLGPAASCIIAETIIGLLKLNPNSVLNVKDGGWRPDTSDLKLPHNKPINTIKDFLKFAGVLAAAI